MCSNLCLQITFLVWKTKCFPLLFTFFVTESTENWSEGRKGRGGQYGSFSFLQFFHTFLFSLFLPRADSLKIWSQKSKQKRKLKKKKYKKCYLETQIRYCTTFACLRKDYARFRTLFFFTHSWTSKNFLLQGTPR
jgi:hypothetical protein